jgi:hypothetical protein
VEALPKLMEINKVRHFSEAWVLTENVSYAQVCRI